MPGLTPRSAAPSKKGFKKAASRTGKKEGGAESDRDATKGGGYTHEAPKQVHSAAGASPEGAHVMNTFIKEIFERIAGEASRLAHYNKRSTITSREIHTAMRLLLPPELTKLAVSEGTKAAARYTSAKQV